MMGETKDSLENGGMKRADGNGYRTPGGVFLIHLKSHVSAKTFKQLMKDSKKRQKELQKSGT